MNNTETKKAKQGCGCLLVIVVIILLISGCTALVTTGDDLDGAEESVGMSEYGTAEEYVQRAADEFEGVADVTYLKDERAIVITPIGDGFVVDIMEVINGGQHDAFQSLVESIKEVSKNGVDLYGEGYSIAVANPLDVERYLIVVQDGKVLYNLLDDL